jgi:D-alanine-D-alanine ligase
MSSEPIIAVFHGGTSAEREVSLGSGKACAEALGKNFRVELYDVTSNAIPAGVRADRHVVFSTLHGTFGEDGGMQRLLDAAGIHYAGCDAAASELTMDKARTKQATATRGVHGARGLLFQASQKPSLEKVVAELGEKVVVKPNDQGSSVGLCIPESRAQLAEALTSIRDGNWLIEQRIVGRELAVGVLNGKAMGVVEIRPKSGIYDYTSKYTKGMTEYLAPAPFDDATTARIRAQAEAAYAACGCRDYSRVDFIISDAGDLFLLEINTLPGMKETSLLPMSARCVGLDFTTLVKEMVQPALSRFRKALLTT